MVSVKDCELIEIRNSLLESNFDAGCGVPHIMDYHVQKDFVALELRLHQNEILCIFLYSSQFIVNSVRIFIL